LSRPSPIPHHLTSRPATPPELHPTIKEAHTLSQPCSPQKTLAVIETSTSAPASPSCCRGRRHKVEMLERQNLELVQRLRKEKDRLEEQQNNFEKQLEEVNTEHTNNLMKMGFLLANQKKVSNII
jgi:DUF438 domain-containing protein